MDPARLARMTCKTVVDASIADMFASLMVEPVHGLFRQRPVSKGWVARKSLVNRRLAAGEIVSSLACHFQTTRLTIERICEKVGFVLGSPRHSSALLCYVAPVNAEKHGHGIGYVIRVFVVISQCKKYI